jgi:hypothetical protein
MDQGGGAREARSGRDGLVLEAKGLGFIEFHVEKTSSLSK